MTTCVHVPEEMPVVPWNPDKHLRLIAEWGEKRGLWKGQYLPGLYPPTGYVVEGVALGFLFLTNAKQTAFCDMFIANPETTRRQRHAALRRILDTLIVDARARGVVALQGTTAVASFYQLLREFGFRTLGNEHHFCFRRL